MQEALKLNENTIILLNDIFKEPEQAQRAKVLVENIVNDRATTTEFSLRDLKDQATKDIQNTLATKDFVRAEISDAKQELKDEIAKLRSEFKEDIANLRSEFKDSKESLLKWTISIQISVGALMVAIIKLL